MVYTVPGNVTHADTPAMRCIPTLPATFSSDKCGGVCQSGVVYTEATPLEAKCRK